MGLSLIIIIIGLHCKSYCLLCVGRKYLEVGLAPSFTLSLRETSTGKEFKTKYLVNVMVTMFCQIKTNHQNNIDK